MTSLEDEFYYIQCEKDDDEEVTVYDSYTVPSFWVDSYDADYNYECATFCCPGWVIQPGTMCIDCHNKGFSLEMAEQNWADEDSGDAPVVDIKREKILEGAEFTLVSVIDAIDFHYTDGLFNHKIKTVKFGSISKSVSAYFDPYFFSLIYWKYYCDNELYCRETFIRALRNAFCEDWYISDEFVIAFSSASLFIKNKVLSGHREDLLKPLNIFSMYYTYHEAFDRHQMFLFLERDVAAFVKDYFSDMELSEILVESHEFSKLFREFKVVQSKELVVAMSAAHAYIKETVLCYQDFLGMEAVPVDGPARVITIVMEEFGHDSLENGCFVSPVVDMYVRSPLCPLPKAWLRQKPEYWAQFEKMAKTLDWSDSLVLEWSRRYPEMYQDADQEYRSHVWEEIRLWNNKIDYWDPFVLNFTYEIFPDKIKFIRHNIKTGAKLVYCQKEIDLLTQYEWIQTILPEGHPFTYQLDENTIFKRNSLVVCKMLMISGMLQKKSRASLQGVFTSLGMTGVFRHSDMAPMPYEPRPRYHGQDFLGSYDYKDPKNGYGYHPYTGFQWRENFDDMFLKDITQHGRVFEPTKGIWYDDSDKSLVKVECNDKFGFFYPRFSRVGTGPTYLFFGRHKIIFKPAGVMSWVYRGDIT